MALAVSIEELQESFLEAIETKDPKAIKRFVLSILEKQESRSIEILESIKLLAERMNSMEKEMNIRFEAVDKRFEAVDKRFESVDKRFEDLIHHMDKRFESVDKRFESVDKRFAMVQWLMGIGFTMLAVLMSVYKFL